MTQTFPLSPEQGLVPSNLAEPQPMPANTSTEDHDLLTTLALKDSLGAALTKQGKYSEAATLLQEVLTTRESLNQSPTSPGMLCTMNNLAAALHHQGHHASAESLHRRVLESDTQTLGISHPDTLTSMHNLAAVLAHQGPDDDKDNAKLSEAAELLQQALQLSQQVNGPRSPQTLRIMGEQVNILLRQEKYEQAEGLAREVLALRREVLRAQHPEIATAMHSLGVVLRKLGKVDEAEALRREERALREIDREKMAGLRDGDGQVAMKEGRYKEAESIFREGLVTGMA
ncbi:MAG: hypothetical protein ASARMPREDX12_008416 [Alectoria sarmentosa]|nr:MAG: hypothetical protein ASARMPREDX12_008416 [Alectoria sarmentosa]